MSETNQADQPLAQQPLAQADRSNTVIIGTYANESNPGLYIAQFDPETGSLALQGQVSGIGSPTFLDVDAQEQIVYAIYSDKDAELKSGIAAYRLNGEGTGLELLNKVPCLPATSCHVALDHARANLILSSYHGGMIGLVAVGQDGSISECQEIHRHSGSSVHPAQTQARAHSVTIDPGNRFAIVADLGADELVIYQLHAHDHHLEPYATISTAPGAGPRHAVFHPVLPYFYVINELNSTITGYLFNPAQGTLTEIETLPTLPEEFTGANACADIHISPDGKFLYGSNRGHDSIAVYEIDATTGRLQVLGYPSVQGKHPRNFALSPDGAYVLAANKDTNNIATFRRDPETGGLEPTGHSLEVPEPVCVRFMV